MDLLDDCHHVVVALEGLPLVQVFVVFDATIVQRGIGHAVGIDGLTCGQMQHHAKNLFGLVPGALKLALQFALQGIVTAEKLVANKVVKLASLLLKEANFFLFGHVLNVAFHLGKCRWLRSFFTPANGVKQLKTSLTFC